MLGGGSLDLIIRMTVSLQAYFRRISDHLSNRLYIVALSHERCRESVPKIVNSGKPGDFSRFERPPKRTEQIAYMGFCAGIEEEMVFAVECFERIGDKSAYGDCP